MKKLYALALIGVLALSSFSFADEFVPGGFEGDDAVKPSVEKEFGQRGGKGFGEKISDRMQNRTGKPERRAKGNPEEMQAKMTEVINTYAPDLLSGFEANWAAHTQVHEALNALKEDMRADHKAQVEPLLEALKAQVEAGEITAEEARSQFQAIKETYKADHEAIRAEIEALKDQYDMDKDAAKAVKDALKVAIEAEDADAAASTLTSMLDMLTNHIAFDQAKLALLQSK